MIYKCKLHGPDKPEVCRLFPQAPSQLKWDIEGNCGYSFDADNNRIGECLRCGSCCKGVAIRIDGKPSQLYEACPHLVEDKENAD